MSPEQTIAKMKEMKLSAAAEAYEHQLANPDQFRGLCFDDRLAILVDYEADVRSTKKIQRLIKGSNMYFQAACPEQINYSASRGLDRSQISRLLDCSYIKKNQNIIFEGASASGNYDKLWIMLRNGLPPQVTRLQQPCPFT